MSEPWSFPALLLSSPRDAAQCDRTVKNHRRLGTYIGTGTFRPGGCPGRDVA
ncbi:MAG: hypothetical protein ABI333_28855 [bacterium]